jgi:tetratricopeptide (TPR) repeat protein
MPGRPIAYAAVFGIAAIALTTVAVAAEKAAPVLRTTVGVVDLADADDNDHVWFELDRIDQRFAFDGNKLVSLDQIAAALKDSHDTGKSIAVHYFIDGATFPFANTKPVFTVHELIYGGKTIAVDDAPPLPDPNAVPLPRDLAAADLAKGIALAGDPDPGEAIAALSRAIASPALETPLQALAYKTRGQVYVGAAISTRPPGAERDKLLAQSLADARAWQALAPDDLHAVSAVGEALAYLGAYEAALREYRQIITRWPEEDFWPEIRIAGVYRSLGDYEKSFAALDDLVKRDGPQDGMAYHYHRGWTLRLAGRLDEAIAEFGAGLKSQPDYGGAFFQRACALAQTGRLREALLDQQEFIKSFTAYGSDTPPSPQLKHDRERADDVERQLEAMAANNPATKTDLPCTGYWDWGDAKREPSPLLGPPAAQGPQGTTSAPPPKH